MTDDKHPIPEDRLMSLRELHAKYGRPSRERIRIAIRNGTGPKGIIRFGDHTSPFLCWESRYREWLLQHGYVPSNAVNPSHATPHAATSHDKERC